MMYVILTLDRALITIPLYSNGQSMHVRHCTNLLTPTVTIRSRSSWVFQQPVVRHLPNKPHKHDTPLTSTRCSEKVPSWFRSSNIDLLCINNWNHSQLSHTSYHVILFFSSLFFFTRHSRVTLFRFSVFLCFTHLFLCFKHQYYSWILLLMNCTEWRSTYCVTITSAIATSKASPHKLSYLLAKITKHAIRLIMSQYGSGSCQQLVISTVEDI